jgi:hypothetical protein
MYSHSYIIQRCFYGAEAGIGRFGYKQLLKISMKNKSLFVMAFALSLGVPAALLGADFTNNEVALKGYEKLTGVVGKNFQQNADMLAAIQDPDRQAPDWKTVRQIKTKLWLQLLDQIDQTRDLKFDFTNIHDGYTANVAPPGFRYSSGIDPSAIKEPEIRLEYEEAIRENHAKAVRFNFELQLKKQDDQLTADALQYFNSVYEKTPEDAKSLVAYLDTIENPQHKSEMKEQLQDFVKLAK